VVSGFELSLSAKRDRGLAPGERSEPGAGERSEPGAGERSEPGETDTGNN